MGISKKILFKSLYLFSFLYSSLFADYIDVHPPQKDPWFTGPLLTPSAYTIPKGHYNIEPYLFVNNNFSFYNSDWRAKRLPATASTINLQIQFRMGLNSFMDFTLTPSFFYNYIEDASSFRFGDLYTELSFQLTAQGGTQNQNGFSSKVYLGELFPLGAYQHLKLDKLRTDIAGGGSFVTTFGFVFSKRWNVYSYHFLQFQLNGNYSLFSQVPVHGLNFYGGDRKTSGTVFPGSSFPFLCSFEYNLTQNLGLALDIVNNIALKTKFKGKTTIPVGIPHTKYNLSLAPAIEYNYSENVGLIAGVWFSAIGRYTFSFTNYTIALNWYV
jgi:hypothetical protein